MAEIRANAGSDSFVISVDRAESNNSEKGSESLSDTGIARLLSD